MAQAQIMRTKSVVGRGVLCALVASACLGFGGCERIEKIEKTVDARAKEAQQAFEMSKQVRTVSYDPLTVTDKVWGGNSALRMHRGMPLPERYENSRGVTLVSSKSMSLKDIVNAVSAQTGIPVRLSSLTPPARGSRSGLSSLGGGDDAVLEMPISYEGSLSGLLDRLGAFFSVSWRYDGATISISRYETRVFVVEAMPGSHEINEGMKDDDTEDSSGSSSSSGSGSGVSTSQQTTLTQNSKVVMSLKYWDELAAVLSAMVSGHGTAIVSPTMGTVTVTTTPDVMATVADYISKENRRLSRQIAVNVRIYSVSLGRNEDFTVAFDGVLKRLGNLTYTSAAHATTTTGMGALSVAILNSTTNARAHATSVFEALSTIGDTTQVAQFSMTTLNNRPVSRRVGTDRNYIQSVTQNTTSSTSTSTIVTPIIDTVRDGFSLQLTPRLLADGRILLQYSLSLIGVQTLGATTFGPNNLPLSLPVTDNRIFVQQSMLRSGQTLVIGGVDQQTTNQNRSGVGAPENFLLGGGYSGEDEHFMMVMALTPQVMDLGADEGRN